MLAQSERRGVLGSGCARTWASKNPSRSAISALASASGVFPIDP
jgi:hypothetical protein